VPGLDSAEFVPLNRASVRDELPNGSEGLVGVLVHVGLALDDGLDLAIGADHERHPFDRQRAEPGDAELFRHRLVGVGQQRETEVVGLVELLLPIGPIGRHPHDAGTEFGELGLQITEVLALQRSTRGHGLDVEVHHHRSGLDERVEADRIAVLIIECEAFDGVSNVHGANIVAPLPHTGTPPFDARSLGATRSRSAKRNPKAHTWELEEQQPESSPDWVWSVWDMPE